MLSPAEAPTPEEEAQQILADTEVKGGLIVHIGCGDGQLTAALHANDSYTVHGLDADPCNIEQARAHIRSQGLYGKVSVEHWTSNTLPYIENLVNLVVSGDLGGISMPEVMRVLAPEGVAHIWNGSSWDTTPKPRPTNIDEWRQYLHDADNNAVARDTVVGPPRHLQWTTDPVWSRSHMGISTVISMVSSQGRLFSIEDKGHVENPFLPGKFTLVARDAFNGIKLWSHDFPDWECITRYIKDMAVQLQRRLAAIDDTVYCTPGLSAPVKAFDAATGEIIKTYAGTTNTQEFAYDDGVLYLVIGDRMDAARYNIVKTYSGKGVSLGGSDPNASFDGCGFDAAYAPEIPNISTWVCDIVAIDANSGAELWRKNDIVNYIGGTLAIRGSYLAYQTKDGVFCKYPATGGKRWTVNKSISSGDGTAPNVLILTDVAVYATEGTSLYAYSLADGTQLWTKGVSKNYEKSSDLYFTGGAVWTGGSGQPKSYNPNTGDLISTITQQKTGPMGHDRCYRNFITERYYINSKTGGADFLLLSDGTEFPHFWTRGTCGFGVLPCNGLLYSTPFSCQCSIEVMKQNMNAYYTEPGLTNPDDPIVVTENDRLEKGPAYGYVDVDYTASDWPTYRHDGKRSGATPNPVSAAGLAPSWEFQLNNPSALTVEDGKVFVSDIDTHTIYALDTFDGHAVWNYVIGSRVDSPPTFYKGLVLFGSRDGWVYCLKAHDGTLSWRFKSLPDKLICAFGRLESAWPVCGSVLVKDGVAYFAAGRNSFLDGGIFQYGLDPQTGNVVYRSHVYGPFSGGFPDDSGAAYKSGIFLTDGNKLYLRGKTFDTQLNPAGSPANHIIATPGFLDGTPQHRTYWRFHTAYGGKNIINEYGEMIVLDGTDYYEMRGFPVARHSYFDPRLRGYELRKTGASGWSVDIPMTTKSMLLADDVLFVAGNPMKDLLVYNHSDRVEEAQTYVASYEGELGGVMWAFSKADGSKLAEYTLDAHVLWDGMAAANGRLYLCLKNGKVQCFWTDNEYPIVDAGEDQTIYPMATAILDANIVDDGMPLLDPCDPCSPPIGITANWTKFDGPGQVTFGDPCVIDTNASFSQWGRYTLRLTAFDGVALSYDDTNVFVCRPGDLDCDNDVDGLDIGLFAAQWLMEQCGEPNDWCNGADQKAGGSVSFGSYAVVASNWLLGVEPAAPTNLVVVAGDSQVSLDWDDNTEADLAGYNVYRSTGRGYVQIASGVAVSDYVDNTVTNDITYYYLVTAVDAGGYESDYSNEASATPGIPNSTHRWTFDFNANDSGTGPAVNGILQDNATAGDSNAKIGSGSLLLDGSGDWVNIDNALMEDSFTDYTVSLWVRPDNVSGIQELYDEGGNSNGIAIRLNGSILEAQAEAGTDTRNVSKTGIPANAWTFVAVTFTGGGLFLYVDSGSSPDDSHTGSAFTLADHVGAAGIGAVNGKDSWGNAGPSYFAGRIDDVRVYDGTALTGSQIQGLYNEGSGGG